MEFIQPEIVDTSEYFMKSRPLVNSLLTFNIICNFFPAIELPRINEKFTGLKYRYAYGIGGPPRLEETGVRLNYSF